MADAAIIPDTECEAGTVLSPDDLGSDGNPLGPAGRSKSGDILVWVRCHCGKIKAMIASRLKGKNGKPAVLKSCECRKKACCKEFQPVFVAGMSEARRRMIAD